MEELRDQLYQERKKIKKDFQERIVVLEEQLETQQDLLREEQEKRRSEEKKVKKLRTDLQIDKLKIEREKRSLNLDLDRLKDDLEQALEAKRVILKVKKRKK